MAIHLAWPLTYTQILREKSAWRIDGSWWLCKVLEQEAAVSPLARLKCAAEPSLTLVVRKHAASRRAAMKSRLLTFRRFSPHAVPAYL